MREVNMLDNISNKEDKILANNFLNNTYYEPFRKGCKGIELFLLGECKANCQYCYLKQHPELSPHELNNYSLVVNNVDKILDWYIENKFCCRIDIFSGEWLTTPLVDQIFNLFEEKFSKVKLKYRPKSILLPDNGHFLESQYYTNKVEEHIEKMAQLGIPVYISLSVDGYYCDYGRKEHKDEFYNILNEFCLKHNYGIHPMLSSDNIKYWIENYKWWRETCPELTEDFMILEVRDNSWTNESLNQFIKFCDFLIEDKYKDFNYDKKEFLKYIFDLQGRGISKNEKRSYVQHTPIRLTSKGVSENLDRPSCAITHNLIIRAGDLAIAPCHRTFYPEQIFGKFNIDENNHITDFEPKNVSALIAYKQIKISCLPYCESCLFNNYCLGHCLGASYETYGNAFVPNKEVCNLMKAKITFILYKLHSLNLLDDEGIEFLQNHYNPTEFKQFYDLYKNTVLNGKLGKDECKNEE